MRETERIVDQLRRSMHGESWHGPAVLEVLEGLDAEQATARPVTGAHTIWELLLHLVAWQGVIRRSLTNGYVAPTEEQNWPPVPALPDEAAWQELRHELTESHRALCEAVLRLPDERLDDPAPGRETSLYVLLHGVIQHNLYHAGQVTLLKKELAVQRT